MSEFIDVGVVGPEVAPVKRILSSPIAMLRAVPGSRNRRSDNIPALWSGDAGGRGYGITVLVAVLQIRILSRLVGARGFVLLPFLGLRSDGVALRKGE